MYVKLTNAPIHNSSDTPRIATEVISTQNMEVEVISMQTLAAEVISMQNL
jgi:uncharacterized protein with FMN-binding domain